MLATLRIRMATCGKWCGIRRGPTPKPTHVFTLKPIGHVNSQLTDITLAPKQGNEGAPSAWLEFSPEVATGLRDLEVGDELLVLTWLDRADRTTLEVHPRSDPNNPLTGVFSTRSPDRPNPIGIHRAKIV